MTTSREHPDRWTAKRRAAVAVFLWPLVITLAGLGLLLSFIGQLPEPVATHWGTGNVPDGFSSRDSLPWLTLLGLVTSWALGALILAVGGRDGMHRRLTVGFAAGMAAFMATVVVGTAWVQRGLADARDAGGVEWPLIVALIGSIGVGLVAAMTVPGAAADSTRATRPVPADAPRTALPGGARPVWSRLAVPSRGLWVGVGVLTAVLLGMALVTRMWVFSLLMLVITVGSMLAFTTFRVTAGESGLTVRSIVGLPTWRVPLEDIVEVTVTKVNPLREFGGWGYRLGLDGRTGFVVRSGGALQVERGNGTFWVVTVDDADEGAALLNTLADQARS